MRIRDHSKALFLTTCVSGVLLLAPPVGGATADRVSNWNATAVTATTMAGQNAVVQSRSLAMVQAAVHDALNAIDPRFESYALEGVLDPLASPDAAIATAAHDTLVGLIPVGALPFAGFGSVAQQTAGVNFANAVYSSDMSTIPDDAAKTRGIAIGQAAAQAILARRLGDGATTFVPYTPGTEPGDWQPTPNPVPFDPPAAADRLPANLPWWGDITTFVLRTSDQFQTDGPPELTSDRYTTDYNEVKAIGAKISAVRTIDQTQIARFWYEGSPSGWSRIARVLADARGARCVGTGAAAGARRRRDGRWLHRRIRGEVPIPVLASRDGHWPDRPVVAAVPDDPTRPRLPLNTHSSRVGSSSSVNRASGR